MNADETSSSLPLESRGLSGGTSLCLVRFDRFWPFLHGYNALDALQTDDMIALSYRSPKTEVRPSAIHGKGLFAIAPIARNEIVAVKGGHIVTRAQWREISKTLGPAEIQIDDDLFIAPVTPKSGKCRCCIQITPAMRTSGCAAKSRSWPCATSHLVRNHSRLGDNG